MAVTFAVSFENLIRRDRLIFIIKLEFLVILCAVSVVLFATGQNFLLKAVFSLLTFVALLTVLRDRLRKAGRRLRRAVIRAVRVKGRETFPFIPAGHPFNLAAAGYEIEAVSEDFRLVKFLDWKPWKIGQQILVLFDVKGKVLAVRDIKHPLKVELLKKLA